MNVAVDLSRVTKSEESLLIELKTIRADMNALRKENAMIQRCLDGQARKLDVLKASKTEFEERPQAVASKRAAEAVISTLLPVQNAVIRGLRHQLLEDCFSRGVKSQICMRD
jgi:hypothetical protein